VFYGHKPRNTFFMTSIIIRFLVATSRQGSTTSFIACPRSAAGNLAVLAALALGLPGCVEQRTPPLQVARDQQVDACRNRFLRPAENKTRAAFIRCAQAVPSATPPLYPDIAMAEHAAVLAIAQDLDAGRISEDEYQERASRAIHEMGDKIRARASQQLTQ
jgi:hypothetical protein